MSKTPGWIVQYQFDGRTVTMTDHYDAVIVFAVRGDAERQASGVQGKVLPLVRYKRTPYDRQQEALYAPHVSPDSLPSGRSAAR